MRLIFMGTPEFAVPSLLALHQAGHEICQVLTQPPRPKNRGHKETISPVHQTANELGLPVFTPASLRDEQVVEYLQSLSADVAIVAAYGLLLPDEVLKAFPLGCINIHPSLLPRWRGAAPIQRTILAGDQETAVAIMQMDRGLDTGDIMMMEKISLNGRETLAELYNILATKGSKLLLETLSIIKQGRIVAVAQSAENITYAKKIEKDEGIINWQLSASEIDKMVRGLNPWPGVSFNYRDLKIKILKADFNDMDSNCPIGVVLSDILHISCGSGVLRPLIMHKPGGKPLSTIEFLRGNPIPVGSIFS